MAAVDPTLLPLVKLQPVANARGEWVALTVQVPPPLPATDPAAPLHALFGAPGLLAALAPLDCILFVADPAALTPAVLELLPPNRVVLAVAAAALADPGARNDLLALQVEGYRVLLDGALPAGVPAMPALRAVSRDCSAGAPPPGTLAPQCGPHLAHRVDSGARLAECSKAGFAWFSGAWLLHPTPAAKATDSTSRKRLLTLLGLLARDAESRDIETLLKQDPALSYQLLKLVNSAAFALSTPISSFAQAINLLGRRQLQRWLQLLLYARQQDDGLANPLLPQAALRAAHMEALCTHKGGQRDAQDLAFMTGVFSLLDVLLGIPMDEIVGALSLSPDVADALLHRTGPLGELLRLVEAPAPQAAQLNSAGIDPQAWLRSQLDAYRWAIQVSRNL